MIDLDIRYKAVVHYNHFLPSLRAVSKIYNVSKSSLHRWKNSGPVCRKRRSKTQISRDIKKCIESTVDSTPLITMNELCAKVRKICNLKSSVRAVGRFARDLGYTRKKVKRTIAHTPPSSIVDSFCTTFASVDDEDLICVDEAGFYVGDHRRYGYSKKGQNIHISGSSTLRRSRFTLIMAIRKTGILHYKILHGNCKKVDFVSFIEELPECVRGKSIIMDNLNSHHSKETRVALDAKGCTALFVPPYSPRYNAIEYAFSLKKRNYRSDCSAVMSDTHYSCTNEMDFASLLIRILDTGEWNYTAQFQHVRKSVMDYLNGSDFKRYD